MKAILTTLFALVCLAACSGDDRDQISLPTSPSTISNGVDIIVTNTQMHLQGVALGVGNIWEERYELADGAERHGLTAALFISVENDPSQNKNVRVHPGQDLMVPGYRVHIVMVEKSRIQVEVVEVA